MAPVSELDEIFKKYLENNQPNLIIANTIKGKGISFIENQVVWHHKLPSEEEYKKVIQELNKQLENLNDSKANLEVFAETLLDLAKKDKEIVVVTSDSRGSGKLTQFGKELPDQIIEVGIAEQNLVGICAGLAARWKKKFLEFRLQVF